MVSKEEDKMKITTDRLKEIIKEEIEVTLTNEEAAEMFGDEVVEGLDEALDPSNINSENIMTALAAIQQVGENFWPVLVAAGVAGSLETIKGGLSGLIGEPAEEDEDFPEDPWPHPDPEM
jgi:hypothetical protein